MTYTADKVFPLNDVYGFAQRVGGPIASLISAIRHWRGVPSGLVSYGATAQARRALCYLALQQHGLWEQFVTECWPTANAASARPIIEELQRDFINNGLLARFRHNLPPEARNLRLPVVPEERIQPPEGPSPIDARRGGEDTAEGHPPGPPPQPPPRGRSPLHRMLIAATKTFAVALISALGAKIGGWIGGVIAATFAAALAVVTPIESGTGSQENHT